MLLVDTLYINNSGGKVLLDELVEALIYSDKNIFFIFDIRCIGDYENVPVANRVFLPPSLKARKKFYKKNFPPGINTVFCFANIPPPVKLPCKVYTYFHNVNIINTALGISLKQRLMLRLKYWYIYSKRKNTNAFIVQSDYVQNMLSGKMSLPSTNILVLPFYRNIAALSNAVGNRREDSFVYISNGNSHKNHLTLLKSWEILAKHNYYPELHLTITEPYFVLMKMIEEYSKEGLKIYNHGQVQPATLYSSARYCIYPSLAESFGLGLVEAIQCGCKVIAADLPYVHAVIKPSACFDPLSETSIADVILQQKAVTPSIILVENKLSQLIELLLKK